MSNLPPSRIVIIDDERPVLLTLDALLRRHHYEPHGANTAAAGTALIRRIKPDLVLLDLGLPDADGIDVLRELRGEFPEMQVIILTAHDTRENVIETIKLGAFHFILKPYSSEELLSLIGRALEQRELLLGAANLRVEKQVLTKKLEKAERQLAPIAKSRSMQQIQELLARVAPTDANVLLLGESGVGKEVMANQVHRLSRRSTGPLVKLNCAAFPSNMIEAELFGYVKGSFTGAVSDFPGMIQEASGGTLFLDEVAEMPPELQTRFLRVLQEREYRPLGSTKTQAANFRLVAATNQSIAGALRNGTLRQDLYYRLNTFQVEIPPLRERKEDIPALVNTFLERFAQQLGRTVPRLTPEAFQCLLDYAWPGNIRELQNAIEFSVILADGDVVTEKQLPKELTLPVALQNVNGTTNGQVTLNLDDQEKDTILKALAQAHGNKKKAAEILGIHRPTLYSKLKRYEIQL